MLLLFQVCFIVGLGYALLSFILGQLLGFLNLGGDFADVGGDFGGDLGDIGIDSGIDFSVSGADAGSDIGVSPFKPTIIAAFLGVFGGAGMIMFPYLAVYVTFILAGLIGLAISFVMYRFVYIPLYRAQNTSAVEKQSLIGKQAKVSEYIPQGKYGKITYYVNGNTYTAPAKSESGDEIKRNTDVKIVSIVKSTYYVTPKG